MTVRKMTVVRTNGQSHSTHAHHLVSGAGPTRHRARAPMAMTDVPHRNGMAHARVPPYGKSTTVSPRRSHPGESSVRELCKHATHASTRSRSTASPPASQAREECRRAAEEQQVRVPNGL